MLASAGSFILGRSARSRAKRISLLSLSVLLLIPGFYLFISGLSDIAIGSIGQYELGGDFQQQIEFSSPDDFRAGLAWTKKHNPELRRLRFRCPDGSVDFTVYLTAFGELNVPERSVECADGFKLLMYSKE